MEANELRKLRQQADSETKEIDREAVLKLINQYEAIVRAEDFWGVRGPKMVEELNALRAVESQARAIVAHARAVGGGAGLIELALGEIDSLRAAQSN